MLTGETQKGFCSEVLGNTGSDKARFCTAGLRALRLLSREECPRSTASPNFSALRTTFPRGTLRAMAQKTMPTTLKAFISLNPCGEPKGGRVKVRRPLRVAHWTLPPALRGRAFSSPPTAGNRGPGTHLLGGCCLCVLGAGGVWPSSGWGAHDSSLGGRVAAGGLLRRGHAGLAVRGSEGRQS